MAANYLVWVLYVSTILSVLFTLWLPHRLTLEMLDYSAVDEEQELAVNVSEILTEASPANNSKFYALDESKTSNAGLLDSLMLDWMSWSYQQASSRWRVYQLQFWGLNTGYCLSKGESMIVDPCSFGETYNWSEEECPARDLDCESWVTQTLITSAVCQFCIALQAAGLIVSFFFTLNPPLAAHQVATAPKNIIINPFISSASCILLFFLLLQFIFAQPESVHMAHMESMFQPCDDQGPCSSLFGSYYDVFTNLHRQWSSPSFYGLAVSLAFAFLFTIYTWTTAVIQKRTFKFNTSTVYFSAHPSPDQSNTLHLTLEDWVEEDTLQQYVHNRNFNVVYPHIYIEKSCRGLRTSKKTIPGFNNSDDPLFTPYSQPFQDFLHTHLPSTVEYKRTATQLQALFTEPCQQVQPKSLTEPLYVNGVEGRLFTCFGTTPLPKHDANGVGDKVLYPSIPCVVGNAVLWLPYDVIAHAQGQGEVVVPRFPVVVQHQMHVHAFLDLTVVNSHAGVSAGSTPIYTGEQSGMEMSVMYTVKPVVPEILFSIHLPMSLSLTMFLPRNYQTLLTTWNAASMQSPPPVPFTVQGILNTTTTTPITTTTTGTNHNTSLTEAGVNDNTINHTVTKITPSLSQNVSLPRGIYSNQTRKKDGRLQARLTSLVGNLDVPNAAHFDTFSTSDSIEEDLEPLSDSQDEQHTYRFSANE